MTVVSAGAALATRARQVIPGGTNSGNRQVSWPLVVREASGATFVDVDGRRYLDYHAAFGPYVLGHNHPVINDAVKAALERVDLIGAGVTEPEIELAELLVRLVPSAERVLLANSGSEATYAALRVARAATGRSRIIKFQGTYHGWHDAVAMNVISPPDRVGRPDPLSLGMSADVVARTTVVPFNDLSCLEQTMEREGEDIAAILVEVIPHNIGCVLPDPGFLEGVRRLATRYDAVLIFDEVITGFRHGLGGYQSIVGVLPDLTVFAKAMANGFPIAALVGVEAIMRWFEPGAGVFFAGTYNGHPVNVSAALATIEVLRDGRVHEHTFRLGERLADGLREIGRDLGIPLTVAAFGSVVVPYFLDGPTRSYEDLLANDTARDVAFRQAMCDEGIFMLPTALKRNHISAAHVDADIDRTLETARRVLRSLLAAGR
jgi:glutamate-1-semialdehyde 2,1-aminomutase